MDPETQVSPGAETQNPAPELDVAPEAEPEVVEPETPEAEPEKSLEDDAAKAIKRMERRIQRLTAARYEAEAKAKQAFEELEKYRQPQEQQPDVDPVQLADVIARVRETTSKANNIAKTGESRFPDFKEAVKTVNDEAGALFTPHGLPTPLGEAILEADDPPALLHYIGSDPDIAAELRGLSPIQAARRIARIEAQMQAPKEPKVSSAPKAIKPVTALKASPGDLRDDMPVDEWAKRFREMRRNRY